MDFTSAGTSVNTPDSDTEPPSPTDPKSNFIRSFSFTNGIFKPCYSAAPPPPQMVLAAAAAGYKECLKNHAACIGGHALDGCGEFMLSLNSNPSDPTSLKCAACGCHRNFHRRENHQHRPKAVLNDHQHRLLLPPPSAHNHNPSPSPSPTPTRSPSPSPSPSLSPSPGPTPSPESPPPVSHLPPSYFASPTQMLLALSSPASGPSDEINRHRQINRYQPNEKKRSRTKFTQDQKAKMCLFAEKVGWKMQKSAENLVEEFCKEIGVGRGVFKVWMHNNKHSRKKRYEDRSGRGGAGGGAQMINSNVDEISNGEGGGRLGFDSMDANHNTNKSSFDLATNGGSSSSS